MRASTRSTMTNSAIAPMKYRRSEGASAPNSDTSRNMAPHSVSHLEQRPAPLGRVGDGGESGHVPGGDARVRPVEPAVAQVGEAGRQGIGRGAPCAIELRRIVCDEAGHLPRRGPLVVVDPDQSPSEPEET